MGEVGPLCVFEINPVPGIISNWSDLALMAASNGLPYDRFLNEIINCAKRSASRSWRTPDTQKGNNAMRPASCLSQCSLDAIDEK